jgi:hypothetical protein
MESTWEWVIGGLLVLIYAHGRFNTPSSNRSSTTTAQYYGSALSYYFFLGFLFVLLGGGLGASPEILSFLMHGGAIENDEIFSLPGPLLAALLLTTLLPNLPLLSKLDEWSKKLFQDMGNIPWEARRLRGKLRRSEFCVPDALKEVVKRKLEEFGTVNAPASGRCPLERKWMMATALYLQISRWPEMKRYDRLCEALGQDYRDIGTAYDRVRDRVASCARLMRELDANRDETVAKALEECKSNVSEQTEALLVQMCEFVARGVLRCELTRSAREARLRTMGFSDFADAHYPLNVNQVVTVGVAVFLAVVFGTLLIKSQSARIGEMLFTAGMVATIYATAVVASIYPKTIWDFANIQKSVQRPVAAYLVSGVMAVCLAFLVSLTFKFLMKGDFLSALLDYRVSYPWFLLTFVASGVTSFLADDFAGRSGDEPRWARWAEGAVAAAALAATALVVHRMLGEAGMPGERVPPLQALISMCAVIGFVIGALVPSWYRNASSLAGTDENSADADVGSPSPSADGSAEAVPPEAGDRVVVFSRGQIP